jgi:hypothetical protein
LCRATLAKKMSAVDALVGYCGGPLLRPLHRLAATLYMHGPATQVGGLSVGFWQGRSAVDVCASLSGVSSQLWYAHPAACHDLLAERFFSYYYALYAVVVGWCVLSCARGVAALALAAAAEATRRLAAPRRLALDPE